MKEACMLALALVFVVGANSTEKRVKEAKFTLPEALEKAAPQVKEGSPVWARLKEDKGRILYVVGFAQGEKAFNVSLDAKTSELVEKTSPKKDRSKVAAASKISVAKAIEIALKKVPGKATGASLGLKKGKAVAEVKVFNEGKLYEVKVDGVSGEVVKVEQEDDDEDDGDEDEDDDDDDDEDDDD